MLTVCKIIENREINRESAREYDRDSDTRCDPVDKRIACPRIYERTHDEHNARHTC